LAAVLAVAKRLEVVAADPDRGRQGSAEAGEPGVAVVVGRAGLAADVLAAEDLRRGAGAALDHVAHHRDQLVGGALVDRALGDLARRRCRQGLVLRLLLRAGGLARGGQGAEVEAVHYLRRAGHGAAATAAAAAGDRRVGLEHHVAVAVADLVDEPGI